MRPLAAMALRAAGLALVMGAAGCVYFNGMYNADHYTHEAESLEGQGRSAEAQDQWRQAEAHADSVVVDHPKSGWFAPAQLVRGRALVHLEDWFDAELALKAALARRLPRERHLEALELLGRCLLEMGHPDSALVPLDSATRARDGAVRSRAWLVLGRASLALGRPADAREQFARSREPAAGFDLASTDLRLGDTAAAGAVYDSLAGARTFDESAWRPALDSLAAAGAVGRASALAARLGARRDVGIGARARLLLDDALRRLKVADTTGAAARWREVVATAPDSVEGQLAQVALIRLTIAAATDDAALATARARLLNLLRAGGSVAEQVQGLIALLDEADTLAGTHPAPDAHWFQRAELLRDSLHAGRLAARAFAEMATRFPSSPWTPKGLIAAIAGGYPGAGADSLRALLMGRYRDSPYTIAALGGLPRPGTFAELEDSLASILAVQGPLLAAGPGGAPAPGQRRDAVAAERADVLELRRRREEGREPVSQPAEAAAAPAPAAPASAGPAESPAGAPPRRPYGPQGPEPPA